MKCCTTKSAQFSLTIKCHSLKTQKQNTLHHIVKGSQTTANHYVVLRYIIFLKYISFYSTYKVHMSY